MAIQVACPSCQSTVHVDDALAGKDILCPNCRQRVSVPSIASGTPERRPVGPQDSDESLEEHDRPRRERGGDLPRWGGDDEYDVPAREDRTRWNATVTGLALIFWAILCGTVVMGIFQVVALAMGAQTFAMQANPGGQPPPEMVIFGLLSMALGCAILVLLILAFVGLCMCCTVPSESGAKGRAVATLVLILLMVVLGIVFGVVMFFTAIRQARVGAVPQPGQMPIGTTGMIAVTALGFVATVLLATVWLMFHKAIADYFQNARLSTMCVWYLIVYIAFTIVSNVLNFISNPMLQGGNVFMMQPSPMLYVTQIVQLIGLSGLMIWYLFLVRETRRSILHDQATTDGDARDRDRDSEPLDS